MAEARREIVTALKFHRAAKKQHRQQEQEQEQEQPRREEEKDRLVLPLPPPRPRRPSEQEPNLCSSWANGFSDIAPAGFRSPCLFFPPPPPPPALFQESLNFPLPNQTLGLNLNFQGFDHLDASPYLPSCNNPSIYASSPSSSSSNYCSVSSGLQHHHPSLGEREISEMKSMGEKHQMEWNDSMNLATSALWLEFLETMGEEKRGGEEDDGYGCYHPFDEAMEFPVWLNAGDESCLEHNLNVNFSDDFCFQNPALPCIEEIQGNEVEWLTGED
ncbi:unnamed protein product [Cuscuta campestris]|uniref:Uncharacterized protein n=1 Tax=Cuscuta campestris TaxID=132261 RepID=A0A484N8G2_9ASTE|nr:unnamed protein product [Cuscuta campestris]